jgi:transcription factor SOX1/3/14/21 (SOX group B)
MAASQMGQVGSYYNPAAAAYGSLSAASMAAAAAAAAAQQSAISGLSAPAQVKAHTCSVYFPCTLEYIIEVK